MGKHLTSEKFNVAWGPRLRTSSLPSAMQAGYKHAN
ncbi:MAG: hypothetical protein ACI9P7_001911, partial [Candidatus Azotimanducaceae bacterium]